MRILQLISTLGFFGAENVLLELSKQLDALKHEVYVGTIINSRERSKDLLRAAADAGLKTVDFRSDKLLSLSSILALRKFLTDHRIDVVHSHNYKSNFYGLTASVGLPLKLVSTCHNWPGSTGRMLAYKILDLIQLRCFHKVIAVSDKVRAELLSWKIGKDKALIIHNGIDTDRFNMKANRQEVRRQLGVNPEERLVGTVSRLTGEKGHLHIIQASRTILASEPDTKFLIVGDGLLMDDLKKEADGLPFIFTGIRADVDQLYAAMDIFILPSLNEGLPMVLLEAMASGRPVIATRVGDISKVVSSGVNGLLIDPGDSSQLADAVLHLLRDREMADRLAEEGRKTVSNTFTSSKMAESYLRLYE